MGDDTTMKEKQAFDELKKRMKGVLEDEMYNDDNMFYRFLKARDFKVDLAETMLRQHLEWREKIDFKNIKQWQVPRVLEKHFAFTMLGFDKEGSVLKYVPFGSIDFRGIFQACTLEDWLKSLIHFFEDDVIAFKKQREKLGKTVEKVVYIANVEHFTLATATDRKVLYNIATAIVMYLNNYPEVLKSCHVINAPSYFNIFFAMLKVFLPSTVLKKIKIYSDDSWKHEFQELFDAETLPGFLGGNRTDPDGNPLCLELIQKLEPVPKTMYIRRRGSVTSLTDADWINLSRGSVHEECFEVAEPGCYLEWQFEAKFGDIKFGLYFKDERGNKHELIPVQKIANDCIESGVYKCQNAGRYIIIFDNSFSFFKSKEVHYKIRLTNPEERIYNYINTL